LEKNIYYFFSLLSKITLRVINSFSTPSHSKLIIFSGKEETYIVSYNYNPSTSSPNIDKDEELTLKKGDFVKVLSPLDDDGFFYAECNGRKGFVPSNYLTKLNSDTKQHEKVDNIFIAKKNNHI
jgi:hypothetical protein